MTLVENGIKTLVLLNAKSENPKRKEAREIEVLERFLKCNCKDCIEEIFLRFPGLISGNHAINLVGDHILGLLESPYSSQSIDVIVKLLRKIWDNPKTVPTLWRVKVLTMISNEPFDVENIKDSKEEINKIMKSLGMIGIESTEFLKTMAIFFGQGYSRSGYPASTLIHGLSNGESIEDLAKELTPNADSLLLGVIVESEIFQEIKRFYELLQEKGLEIDWKAGLLRDLGFKLKK